MNFIHHLFISLVAGSIYLAFSGSPFSFSSFLPWIVGGVLIDLDHVVTFIQKKKTINPKTVAKIILEDYYLLNQRYFFLHSIEFILLLSLITYQRIIPWQYLAAYLIHIIFDGTRARRKTKDFDFLKRWSLTYYLLYFFFSKKKDA